MNRAKEKAFTFHICDSIISFRTIQVRLQEGGATMKKDQYVVKQGDHWAVKGANNSRATAITRTQREAMAKGRQIAMNQHSELRVQGRDGKFRICNSYGEDSCPPKDKNL